MRSHESFSPSELHVISVVHNPLRFRSRHVLFQDFMRRCRAAGVTLHVVEASFGDRYHDHVEPGVDHQTLLVQNQELWVKESMIRTGLSRLPEDAKYVAWIDGDVSFARLDWAQETIHQLQHYRIVQMFQTAADLGPQGEIMQVFNGFGYSKAEGLPELLNSSAPAYYYAGDSGRAEAQRPGRKFWHPGFAWAARREVLDQVGFIDWSVLGSADHIMALAWMGKVDRAVPSGLHPNYIRHARMYQELCDEHVRGDIGYVPGTLLHWWHGKKRDRRYIDRWEILKRHQYDPERDIRRDTQGLVQLTRAGERMRDDLRGYFRARNEDSIDVE
jgi:hypothetical protein